MIRIDPVGEAEALTDHMPHAPLARPVLRPGSRPQEEASVFQGSLLGQHALQLDPDGAAAGASPEAWLSQLSHLLALLEERLADMRERLMLGGGRPSRGLFAELMQLAEVLARLVPIWQQLRPVLGERVQLPRGRLLRIYGGIHLLHQVLRVSGEVADRQWLQESLQASEQSLLGDG